MSGGGLGQGVVVCWVDLQSQVQLEWRLTWNTDRERREWRKRKRKGRGKDFKCERSSSEQKITNH